MKHLPYIEVYVQDHKAQNYDTAGDYCEIDGEWVVSVSKMKDWRYEALVTIHELVEMFLTKNQGISWEEITEFDIKSGHCDPGSLKEAPYHREHRFAEMVEKMVAKKLGVDWTKYNEELDSLEYG